MQGVTKTISLFDETGKMLSTFDVLKKISEDWDNLTEAEQSSLALTLGMKTQIDVLTSTLGNFDSALEAVKTAEEAEGSAMKENARYMESLEAKINNLKAQFSELVLGEGGIAKFLKILIDTGTAILKFANSDIGQLIIKTTLLITTVNLLNKGFNKLTDPSIIKAPQMLIALYHKLTQETIALGGGMGTMVTGTHSVTQGIRQITLEWLKSPFGMGTVAVGAIYAIYKAFDYFTESTDEARQKLGELSQEYEESEQKEKEITKQLEETKKRIEEINSLGGADVTKDGELETLKEQTKELELQLAIEQEKQRLAQEEANKKANKTVFAVEEVRPTTEKNPATGEYQTVETGVTRPEIIEQNSKRMMELASSMEIVKKMQDALAESGLQGSESWERYRKEAQRLEAEYNDLSNESSNYAKELKDEVKATSKGSRARKVAEGAINGYATAVKKWNKATRNATDSTKEQAKVDEDQAQSLDGVKSKIEDNINELTSMYDTFEDLNDIVKDYNDGNGLTSDSLTKLLNMDSKYLALLEEKDGKLVLNKKAMVELANAQIDEAEASAVANTMLEIQNNTTGDNTGSLQSLANQAGITSGSLINITQDIIGMATSAGNATTQIQNMFSALGGQGKVGDNKANEEAVKGLQNTIKLLENQRKNISSHINSIGSASKATHRNTGSTGKNTSARDKNRKAIEKQNKALDKQTKILEEREKILEKELDERDEVFDYFEDLIDKEIEALEDAKDKELSGIEDKIEAIEKEQEAYNEATDDKIETLEDEKDAIDEYYDNELEKLEEENKAIEENIRLRELQDNLAKAKTQKVKVFKNGQFTYEADEEAINKAQSELLNYKEESSKQKAIDDIEARRKADLAKKDADIKDLENESKTKNKNWKADIKELEEDYEEAEDEWDAKIEKYEGYQKELDRIRNYYENKNKKHLANQYINEKKNWEDRLKALKKFAQGYERISKKLENVRKAIDKVTEIKEKNKDKPKKKRAKQAKKVTATAVKQSRFQKHRYYAYDKVKKKRLYTTPFYDDINDAKKDMNDWFYKKPKKDRDNIIRKHQAKRYAQGSYSLPNDQIVLVGDPNNISNRELVVGSKLNKGDGILADAQAGTGIIPHGNNLTEQLVKLANWSQNGGFERVSNNTSNSSVVQIENINLPQVKNGEEFVSYLENNFVNQAFQYASTRR